MPRGGSGLRGPSVRPAAAVLAVATATLLLVTLAGVALAPSLSMRPLPGLGVRERSGVGWHVEDTSDLYRTEHVRTYSFGWPLAWLSSSWAWEDRAEMRHEFVLENGIALRHPMNGKPWSLPLRPHPGPLILNLVAWTAGCGVPATVVILARRRLDRSRLAREACRGCGYSMRGVPSSICPECGNDGGRETMARRFPDRTLRRVALVECLLVVVTLGILVLAFREPDATVLRALSSGDTEAAIAAFARLDDPDRRFRTSVSDGSSVITPLMLAASYDDAEFVTAALAAGANVDSLDRSGRTALHHATRHGNRQVAGLLLDAGADVSRMSARGWSATPLSLGAETGDPELVRLLLDHGANPNLFDIRGVPPLARVRGDATDATTITRLLLDAGAEVNAEGARTTALIDAARSGPEHLDRLRLLLRAGGDVNGRSADEVTPLHAATRSGNLEAARLLIARGADVDATDRHGSAPIHTAVAEQQIEALRLLLAAGADPDLALSRPRRLHPPSPAGSTPLHMAVRAWSERQPMMRMLVEEGGADVDARDEAGLTPLHVAVMQDRLDGIRVLLELGADPNATDEAGYTPLHHAVGRSEIARILLDHGADPARPDDEGRIWSPEDRAMSDR